jgi:hypothetical protein
MNFKFESTPKKNENAEFERKKFGGKSIELQQQYLQNAFQKSHCEYGEKSLESFKTQSTKLTKNAKKYIENSEFKQEIEMNTEPIKLEKKRKRELMDENEKIIKRKKEELKNKHFERKENKANKMAEIYNVELQIQNLKSDIQEIKKQEILQDNMIKDQIENCKNEIKTLQTQQKMIKEEIKEKDVLIIEQIEQIIDKPISEIC